MSQYAEIGCRPQQKCTLIHRISVYTMFSITDLSIVYIYEVDISFLNFGP